MSLGGKRGWLMAVVLAVAAPAVVACGDDADTAAKPTERTVLIPNEEPSTFASRMANLLETARSREDCKEIYEINGRSAVRFACPAPAATRKSMAKFKVVDAEIHGAGGIVDYTSGAAPKGAAIVLYAAPNRRWGVGRLGVLTPPSVGTSDSDIEDDYRDAADRYLEAVVDRDCDEWLKFAATEFDDKKKNCGQPFDMTKPLARRLKRNPDAETEYVGGNGTYGFLSIETAKPVPEKSTIGIIRLMQDSEPTYAVLNVVPSPTTADMEQLREEIRIQQRLERKRAKPSQEPLER